jgi:hypothetical protein
VARQSRRKPKVGVKGLFVGSAPRPASPGFPMLPPASGHRVVLKTRLVLKFGSLCRLPTSLEVPVHETPGNCRFKKLGSGPRGQIFRPVSARAMLQGLFVRKSRTL